MLQIESSLEMENTSKTYATPLNSMAQNFSNGCKIAKVFPQKVIVKDRTLITMQNFQNYFNKKNIQL